MLLICSHRNGCSAEGRGAELLGAGAGSKTLLGAGAGSKTLLGVGAGSKTLGANMASLEPNVG